MRWSVRLTRSEFAAKQRCLTAGLCALVLLCGCAGVANAPAGKEQTTRTADERDQRNFDEGVGAFSSGRYDLAAERFREVANRTNYPSAWLNLALAMDAQNDLDGALSALQSGVSAAPENCELWVQRGLLMRRQGDLVGAEQSYRTCLQRQPEHVLAWRNLGVLYDLYLDQPDQALDAYQHSQRSQPAPDPEVAEWISNLENHGIARFSP